MIYIGIDISLKSTAMCIDIDEEKHLFIYSVLSKDYKWNKLIKDVVNIKQIEYNEYYVDIEKLKDYDIITDYIVNDIIKTCKIFEDDISILIEGFNYSLKRTNIIIDIVEFSTILKYKIFKYIKNVHIDIISPKTLKLGTCNIVYGLKHITDKNKISRNKDGIPGGNFEKKEMFLSLMDYDIKLPFKDIMTLHKDSILSKNNKIIKKPYDDIIDSIWLCENLKTIIKNNNI